MIINALNTLASQNLTHQIIHTTVKLISLPCKVSSKSPAALSRGQFFLVKSDVDSESRYITDVCECM